MTQTAAYDQIADWYEEEFLPRLRGDPLEIGALVTGLLGPGQGPCLEVGSGTGANAALVRGLGWTPVGVDLSAGMLRHSRGRLPAAQADAVSLPVRDRSVPAVITVMAHTDLSDYPAVVREIARVLIPGGVYVHIGVHPCFCGGFADRTDPAEVVIRPGYRDSRWTRESFTDRGGRDKVGAMHRPLPELLHTFLAAGLALERFAEGGTPTRLCSPSGPARARGRATRKRRAPVHARPARARPPHSFRERARILSADRPRSVNERGS